MPLKGGGLALSMLCVVRLTHEADVTSLSLFVPLYHRDTPYACRLRTREGRLVEDI